MAYEKKETKWNETTIKSLSGLSDILKKQDVDLRVIKTTYELISKALYHSEQNVNYAWRDVDKLCEMAKEMREHSIETIQNLHQLIYKLDHLKK